MQIVTAMIGGAVRQARGVAFVLVGVLIGAVFTAGMVVIAAAPAAAHTALESSTPEDGTRVNVPPDQVELDFTEPIRTQLTQVIVRGPGGERFELGGPQSATDRVTQPLRPLGAAGEYEILFRVVAADGHPLTGEIRFTVTRPGPGASANAAGSPGATAPAGPDAADNAADADRDDGGVSPLLLAVFVLAIVAFVAGAVWFGRKVTRDVD